MPLSSLHRSFSPCNRRGHREEAPPQPGYSPDTLLLERMHAHVAWAAAATDRVTLDLDGQPVLGRFLLPMTCGIGLPFVPRAAADVEGPDLPTLMPGRAVRLDYGVGVERFRLLTTVHRPFGERGVLLSMPGTLKTTSRRWTPRVAAPPGTFVVLRRERLRFDVVDISPGGLGLACDPLHRVPIPGTTLVADLHTPGFQPMPLRMVVVRPGNALPHARHVLVGCRITGMATIGAARIAARFLGAEDLLAEQRSREGCEGCDGLLRRRLEPSAR